MKVKLMFFGVFTELFETDSLYLENVFSVEEVIGILSEKFPKIHSHTYRISVNRNMIEDTAMKLSMDDEIALLPPFSGG